MIQDVIALEKILQLQACNKNLNGCLVQFFQTIRARSIEAWLPLREYSTTSERNGQFYSFTRMILNIFQRQYVGKQAMISSDFPGASPWMESSTLRLFDILEAGKRQHEDFLNAVLEVPESKLFYQEVICQGVSQKLLSFLFNIGVEEAMDAGKLMILCQTIIAKNEMDNT